MQTLVFGHRGFPHKFPENSLAGFKYAVEHNIDGLEFDVHLTKDSIPVIMHDEKINRTTDGSGYIKDYTYNELKQFHLANGEVVPKLDDLLKVVANQDVYLNLEFKTDNIQYKDIVPIVLKKIANTPLVHPVIFSSFHFDTLKNVLKCDPHADCNYLTKKHIPDTVKWLAENHLNDLHVNYYQPGLESRERVWTINDRSKMQQLFNHHVAAIITNDFEKAFAIRGKLESKEKKTV